MNNSLQAALNKIKADDTLENNKPHSRDETVLVGAHLSPDIHKQLRILAAEENKKQHILILEALELLFSKYNKL
jgi:hypothetical protein